MANYTGLSELRNHPHRSGFDISQKHIFSAKVGEILPTYWDISLTGDKYTLRPEYFTRTRPVQTSAYTRIREYWDVYTVPLRLLWKSAPTALTQMGDENPLQATGLGDWLTVKNGLPTMSLLSLGRAVARVNRNVAEPNPTGDIFADSLGFLNQFGFSRGSCAYKLLSYLGYGNINVNVAEIGKDFNWATETPDSDFFTQKYLKNYRVNVLPLLAYNKIYQDHFRWNQWEKPDPSSYNVDYYDGTSGGDFFGDLPDVTDDYWANATMFDLRYCNYKKDLLMGVLPNSQFGDVAMVEAAASTPDGGITFAVAPNTFLGTLFNSQGNVERIGAVVDAGTNSYSISADGNSSGGYIDVKAGANVTLNISREALSGLRTQFSILTLRQQLAVQKWKEIAQSVDYDYVSQIEAHHGVKLPKALSNMCTWHGGIARNLDISEVVNNNLADSQADIKGKGVGSGSDSFTIETKEPSVVMVIYHAEPVLDYVLDAPDPQLFATETTDMPIPEFDNIGMESLSLGQMFNSKLLTTAITDANTSNLFVGYQPRYYSWKTKLDRVSGAFTTNATDATWVAPFNLKELLSRLIFHGYGDGYDSVGAGTWSDVFNFNFFKINPKILDSIFVKAADSTFESDQLLINSYFDVKVVRNLSRDGIDY